MMGFPKVTKAPLLEDQGVPQQIRKLTQMSKELLPAKDIPKGHFFPEVKKLLNKLGRLKQRSNEPLLAKITTKGYENVTSRRSRSFPNRLGRLTQRTKEFLSDYQGAPVREPGIYECLSKDQETPGKKSIGIAEFRP